MKRILKSLLVMSMVAAATAGASGAYFSSQVSAVDNEINTGTLAMAIDSTRAHNYVGTWNTGVGLSWDGSTVVGAPFDAYVVAYDLDGVSTPGSGPLEAWNMAAPGTYVAYAGAGGIETLPEGNRSVWFSVRNWGDISSKATVTFTGEWNGMRTAGACSTEVANDSLIKVQNVHVYQIGGSNCESHEECRNIRDGLNSQGATYTNDTDLAAALNFGSATTLDTYSFALSSDGTTAGNAIALDGDEYAIVRVDLNFDPAVGGVNYNCYQGAQYLYDVTVDGSQLADPSW